MKMTFILAIALLLSGCITGTKPKETAKADAAAAKVDTLDAQKIGKAAANVYAVGLSLRMADPSGPVETAQQFNDRAAALLPQPDVVDAAFHRKLVSDLLSTNSMLKADAEKRLAGEDAKLAKLQGQLNDALETSKKREAELREAFGVAQGKADKWDAMQRRNFFGKLWEIGGPLLFAGLTVAFPAFGMVWGKLGVLFPSLASVTRTVPLGMVDRKMAGIAVGRNTFKGLIANKQPLTPERALEILDSALAVKENEDENWFTERRRLELGLDKSPP